jgi:hypothetical protein
MSQEDLKKEIGFLRQRLQAKGLKLWDSSPVKLWGESLIYTPFVQGQYFETSL